MSPVMEAHLRLLSTLPKRTHEARLRDVANPDPGAARKRRGIAVQGREYASVRDACKGEKTSTTTLYNMLDSGKAKYL